MATYCDCGDVAEVFYDKHGNELYDPCCKECWYFQQEQLDELFSSGALISAPDNDRRTMLAPDADGGGDLDD